MQSHNSWFIRLTLVCAALPVCAANILFDASHREMAGNADWVVDADQYNNSMPAFGSCASPTNESNPPRFPTPAQSGITPATPETYWAGAASAMAVALAKAGHTIENLPTGAAITFGNGANPQDLSNYKVFIIPEPQTPFTAAERTAILAFVQAGGGLFMIADHETSDRDCDGFDSPAIFNLLTGATSTTSTGLFGIWFRVNGAATKPSEDWFDDAINNNVETNPADPIINGPFGSGLGGLGFFGATSMDINPADNPSVTAHVWRTGQVHNNLRVTFATATYGSGRVAAIGDSSPLDDGTGDPGDTLYLGWDRASGGVANAQIHLNTVAWMINAAPDTTPPQITAGPAAAPADCSAVITWTTDENATRLVNYGGSAAYGSSQSVPGLGQNHAVTLTGLTPAALYHYAVSSSDGAGNGPVSSVDATFTTLAAAPPAILTGPTAAPTGVSATITWTTNEPADSLVEFGTTPAYGSSVFAAAKVTTHSMLVTGLTPQTTYNFRVGSNDSCAPTTTYSGNSTFTTGDPGLDIGGWLLEQFNSTQSFTLPAGTVIPGGGYVVVARNASRAQFEAVYGALPGGTVFINSNSTGSCAAGCFPLVNGGESYRLKDSVGAIEDGTTATFTAADKANQRTAPGAAAGSIGSWNILASSFANPGSGAGASSAAGVVINELADAADFNQEYIELYYDAGSVDTASPAPINPLSATPTGATTVRLNFTAVGDDGTSGTATSYQLRRAATPIRTEADFTAATVVSGLTAPLASGQAEVRTVSGLTANTSYCFAIKAVDEASNAGGLSNSPCATTAITGGGGVNHLVISQIRVAGTGDDVVEIFNPTAAPISVASYSVQNLSTGGVNGFQVALTGTIPAGGWLLAAANGYTGSPTRNVSLLTNNFANSAGHVVLASKLTGVTGCTDIAIVDKVGYGAAATCPEGGSGRHVALPPAGQSAERKPGGASGNGTDTDDNANDFQLNAAPVYRNLASTPVSTAPALGNVGRSLFLTDSGNTRLDWGSAYSATGYRVYRSADPASFGAIWNTVAVTTINDAAVPAPIQFYKVLATDGTNESAD